METAYEYVLVGGGVASLFAAQNIRERDAQGSILILKAEQRPPYERPPLSKDLLLDPSKPAESAYLQPDDFYPKNRIELRKSTRATALDTAAKRVTLEGGDTIRYGKLLLATGSEARPLDVPGAADRTNLYTLRRLDDSLAIREAIGRGGRVVIVGAGYIGMEVGADACVRGLDVTIVAPDTYPWSRFASERFGKFLQRYYEGQGVRFLLGDQVASIEGTGSATEVVTKNGRRLAADFVIAGVGAKLNLELAKAAGLKVDERNGVRVNEFLETSAPSVYAAGDIAFFNDIALQKEWHAEHHMNAIWQGEAVGKIMAGERQPFDQVAYFFSDEFDLHMVLRGDPDGGKSFATIGEMDSAEFTELYAAEDGRLTMGIAVSRDFEKLDPGISDTLERLIRARVNLKGREAEIGAPGFDLNRLG
jgi:NADPH-dependent 2,4-dienoyl-CoA reductase/sulfur reductase-like enzyme